MARLCNALRLRCGRGFRATRCAFLRLARKGSLPERLPGLPMTTDPNDDPFDSRDGAITPRETHDAKPLGSEHPAFARVQETPGLPRVLLVGDSISIGYTLPVRALLAGRANVLRPYENCGHTSLGLERLDEWLEVGEDEGWDLIHFNFGLHDLKYLEAPGAYEAGRWKRQAVPPPVYAKQLCQIVERLRQTNAQLVFATTTPVPRDTPARWRGDAVLYNQVALEIMSEEAIPVNDLFAVAEKLGPAGRLEADVHYTLAGYETLGKAVARCLSSFLDTEK